MHTRPIPSSGELLPVIGCGTYRGFDVEMKSAAYRQLPGVLEALFAAGGSVIDSSPMYGRAEAVTGALLAESNMHAKAFIATKVWTRGRDAGIAEMQQSLKLLRTDKIDLMQIHNLLDWKTHLPTLRAWKEAGRIRYLGITHYTASAFADLEAVMRSEPIDFVQLNYSVADRAAERRLLPLAARTRHRGARQCSARERQSFEFPERPSASAVVFGNRMQQLGAVAAEIRHRSPGHNLRDTGHGQTRTHGRQRARRYGSVAGRSDAQPDRSSLRVIGCDREKFARRSPKFHEGSSGKAVVIGHDHDTACG